VNALKVSRAPLAIMFLTLGLVPLQAHAMPTTTDSRSFVPRSTYLALGDSLAFGYQENKINAEVQATGTADPATFNTGYVDNVAARLAKDKEGLAVVNYGCPGETTTSFLSGGCPYPYPLHAPIGGSQMATALTFLGAHSVDPITIDLGANDLLGLISQCGGATNLVCIQAGAPAVVGTVYANLNTIFASLRHAAPRSRIITMELYNPYAAYDPRTNAIITALNGAIAAASARNQVLVADTFTPFNLTLPQPQTICALTFFCTALHDIHPTDAGYYVIGQQFLAAGGYGRDRRPDPTANMNG
jgi:lysophospholipase L1-like esterase